MIKELLETQIKKQIPTVKCAVLLSGGVDSLSVALAAYNVGIKVIAYSFHLEGNESYDFKTAQKFSEQMGWTFKPTIVPTDNLFDDWLTLVELECKKKTHFECIFPFIYTFPMITEKYVLTGVGADSHYVLSKKGMMHFKDTVELMNKFRYNYFHGTINPGGLEQTKQFCDEYNKELCVPYFEPEVYDYFYDRSWEEINKPYQKALIKDRFDEFKKIKVKPHINYQLCAEIDKLFENLIDNKEINIINRTRVMDICRDWSKLVESTGSLENLFEV